MSYPVGAVAELAGVTVRTLHHYDRIGLLSPRGRSAGGYRLYGEADLERLQQILFYRELGFSLEEIAAILDDPDADATAHLRRQHALLTERIKRLESMVAAVEHAMEAQRMGISLTPEERFEVFGDFNPDDYAEEVEQRWGDTDAYRESQRRTRSYGKEDWLRIRTEADDTQARVAAAYADGVEPGSTRAMDLAEEHRQHISRWFYECGYPMHRCLAEMFVADPRFRATYDDVAPGLAQWFHDAILANADRAEVAS
jgi:MerR family transcriptional regulator, thiopeptide resistance regulator